MGSLEKSVLRVKNGQSCTGWLLFIVQQWKSTGAKPINVWSQSLVYAKNINPFGSMHFLSFRAVSPLEHLLMIAIFAQA